MHKLWNAITLLEFFMAFERVDGGHVGSITLFAELEELVNDANLDSYSTTFNRKRRKL